MVINVGSRDSALAVAQSELVMGDLKKLNPSLDFKLVTMKTTGDIILDRTLDKIGGKGLFVKELEQALLEGHVDIVVHSYKDVPMVVNPEIPIVAVSKRENPKDVLILPNGINHLNDSKPIGCSSMRRRLQLANLYPEAAVQPVRGNVLTRLKKLDTGEYSALVLAYAGIKRLGLEHRINRIFETTEIIPSACQGILAIQARKDYNVDFLLNYHHKETYIISECERSFVRTLNGGCSAPVAAFAQIDGDVINLTGFYMNEKDVIFKDSIVGKVENAVDLGKNLAKSMM